MRLSSIGRPARHASLPLALALSTLLLACGSSNAPPSPDSSGGDSTNGTKTDGPNAGERGSDNGPNSAAPLSCSSLSFCSSISVAAYHGKTIVPEPQGGTLRDGLYQLAYALVGDGSYAQSGGVYESGDRSAAVWIQDGRFRWVGFSHGNAGTVKTSGNTITFKSAENCDDATGERTSTSESESAYEFTVDASGTLLLFGELVTSGGNVRYAKAYVPANSPCADTVSSIPKQPGPSANCSVRNCGCTAATNKPADADTCKFVRGG
jgi:hypothetical protein